MKKQPQESKRLTTAEAAKVIGCSVSHVYTMIRQKKLLASRETFHGQRFYEIELAEAERVRDAPKERNSGFPRGSKRRADLSKKFSRKGTK